MEMQKKTAAVGQVDSQLMHFTQHLQSLLGHDNKDIYSKASAQKIQQYVDNFPLTDSQGTPFAIGDSVDKFKHLSPGVFLLFKMMRHLILLLGAASIVALIQFALLIKSPLYQGYQKSVRIGLLRLTIASLQPQDSNLYMMLDLAMVLLTAGFLVYWSERLRRMAQSCNQISRLPSYLTVQLRKVPEGYSEGDLLRYLEQVESVRPHEIYTGRDYGRFLNHYKKLTDCAIDLRIMRELYDKEDDQISRHRQAAPLLSKLIQLCQHFCKIQSQSFNELKYRPVEVFLVMASETDREKLLVHQSQYLSCLRSRPVKSSNFPHYDFKPCQVEPEAIAWENIGISRINYYARALLVLVVIGLFTMLGIILIFILEVFETASIGQAYYYSQKDTTIQPATGRILSGSTQTSSLYVSQMSHGKLALLIIATPLIVFICKKTLMKLLTHFVHFRKHPTEISRIKSQTYILTFFYFTVISLLHLVLYLKPVDQKYSYLSLYQMLQPIIRKLFSWTSFEPVSIHTYSDFSLDWYKQVTFFIIIISSTSFNVSNLFHFALSFFSFAMQRRRALREKTIYGASQALLGADLHIEYIYASMIVIVLFALVYCCSFPIVVLFALINMLVLFYTTKWVLIKYGSKPMRMGHSLSRVAVNLLLIGVVVHCIMVPMFLGADDIGFDNSASGSTISGEGQKQAKLSTFAERYHKFGPYYLTIAVIVICYAIFRKMFHLWGLRILKNLMNKGQQSSEMIQRQDSDEKHFEIFYPSYSMHNIPKYAQIVKNIYRLNKQQATRTTYTFPDNFEDLISTHKILDLHQGLKQFLEVDEYYLDRAKYPEIHQKIKRIAQSAGLCIDAEALKDLESSRGMRESPASRK